jgi:uncharacterized membrane protein YfhO
VEQVRLLDPAAGTARQTSWSPNAVAVEVDLARPTDVLVNQNWNEHWTADGGEVKSVNGRLGVAAPAGRRTITLRYKPRSFAVGARVSAASGALALLLLAVRLRRRRRPL